MKKKEIVIVVVALVLALVGYLTFSFVNSNKTNCTVKNASGDLLLEFDINEDNYYTLEGEYGTFHIEVKDGQCRATHVDCPNHNCEAVGWISPKNPLPIVCIPNNIVIRIDE